MKILVSACLLGQNCKCNGGNNLSEAVGSYVKGNEVDLAILQSRSPTCGVKQIYDGSFSGNLIKGQGIFAKALIAQGIKTIDSEDIS